MASSSPNRRLWGVGRLTVVSLIVAEFFVTLDGAALVVALPTIRDEFDADMGALQWAQIAYMIAGAAVALPTGTIADRLGRRTVTIAALLTFSAGCLLTSLAPTMAMLTAARAVTGAGAAAISVLTLALLTGENKIGQTPAIVGTWTAVSSGATVLAPAVSGALIETAGWRWMFAVAIPPAVWVAVVLLRHVPGRGNSGRAQSDWMGSALLTVATFFIVSGLNAVSSSGEVTASTAIVTAVGAGLVLALVGQQMRARVPLMDWAALRRPPLPLVLATRWLLTMVFVGTMFQQTMLLQNGLGFSPFQAGAMDIPPAIMAMLLAASSSRIGARLGLSGTLVTAILGIGVGLGLLGAADLHESVALLVVALMLVGAGYGLENATLGAATMGHMPRSAQGAASGSLSLVTQLAGILGIAVAGTGTAVFVTVSWNSSGGGGCSAAGPLLSEVIAGSIAEIQAECGADVAARALAAYVDGVTDALWIGAVFLAVLAISTGALLRGRGVVPPEPVIDSLAERRPG